MSMTVRPRTHSPAGPQQSGVTLIVVLLVLMVVTVLGVGGAQIALLAERSTRYDRDYLVAFQAAEAALLDAEFDIRGEGVSPDANRVAMFKAGSRIGFAQGCSSDPTTQGLCLEALNGDQPVWLTVDFLTTTAPRTVEYGSKTGRPFNAGDTGVQPERKPRYVIEVVTDKNPGGNSANGTSVEKLFYRITALGFGPRKEVQAMLQTIYRKD